MVFSSTGTGEFSLEICTSGDPYIYIYIYISNESQPWTQAEIIWLHHINQWNRLEDLHRKPPYFMAQIDGWLPISWGHSHTHRLPEYYRWFCTDVFMDNTFRICLNNTVCLWIPHEIGWKHQHVLVKSPWTPFSCGSNAPLNHHFRGWKSPSKAGLRRAPCWSPHSSDPRPAAAPPRRLRRSWSCLFCVVSRPGIGDSHDFLRRSG